MANWGSNIIGGAGTGAAVGSAVGPWGALAGGVLGGLAGVFTSWNEAQDEEDKRKILDQAKKDFDLTQDEVDTLMYEFYTNPDNFLGTREDVDAYKAAVNSYDPNQFVYDFEKPFEYDKDVDDFINPYYDKIIDDTTNKIQHSAAGAGIGRGTGAANAIAQGVAQKEDELFNTALQQYNTDRAQTYSEWSGNIDKMQQRLNALKSATDTQLTMKGNLANDYLNQKQEQVKDSIASLQNRSNGNLQLANMGLLI